MYAGAIYFCIVDAFPVIYITMRTSQVEYLSTSAPYLFLEQYRKVYTHTHTHTHTQTKKYGLSFLHMNPFPLRRWGAVYFSGENIKRTRPDIDVFLIHCKLSTCFTSAMMVAVTATSCCQGQTSGNNRGMRLCFQQSHYFSHFYICKDLVVNHCLWLSNQRFIPQMRCGLQSSFRE